MPCLVGERMRWLCLSLLTAAAGCQACQLDVSFDLARSAPVTRNAVACAAPTSADLPPGPVNLAILWDLALTHNPSLREAQADVEAARGRLIQAGKYPNPRLVYEQEELGTKQAEAGALRVQVTQEILTAGKRRLEKGIATR